VVLDHLGRSVFFKTMHRQQDIRYAAFDLLSMNKADLRHLTLLKRKQTLKRILPEGSQHVFYVDHLDGNGQKLFALACRFGLEGIVAKRADSTYEDLPSAHSWIKIKNPSYKPKQRTRTRLKHLREESNRDHEISGPTESHSYLSTPDRDG